MKKKIFTFLATCLFFWNIPQAMEDLEDASSTAITPYELVHGHKQTLIMPYHIEESLLTPSFLNRNFFMGENSNIKLRFRNGSSYRSPLDGEFSLFAQAYQVETKVVQKTVSIRTIQQSLNGWVEINTPKTYYKEQAVFTNPMFSITFKNTAYWNTVEVSISWNNQSINETQKKAIAINFISFFSQLIKKQDAPILYFTAPEKKDLFWSVMDEKFYSMSISPRPVLIQGDIPSIALCQALSMLENEKQRSVLENSNVLSFSTQNLEGLGNNQDIDSYFNPKMFQ